jgi:hypothetical protein
MDDPDDLLIDNKGCNGARGSQRRIRQPAVPVRTAQIESINNGADGGRTRNLQNAILARSQLRHGPNSKYPSEHGLDCQLRPVGPQ